MTRTFARKRFRNSFAATALLVIAACSNVAQAATYTMYRDPGCGCCLKWANHFENGMDAEVATVDTTDMGSVKADKGDRGICHRRSRPGRSNLKIAARAPGRRFRTCRSRHAAGLTWHGIREPCATL